MPEAAFFHKPSRTLLVTDAVVYVARDPPDVIPSKVRGLFGTLLGFRLGCR